MKISTIGIGLLSAALVCGTASAAETDYSAGARALPLRQAGGTARATAMGSAVVAVPDGSASLLWNPAGLSRMRCSEVGFHHNTGLGDTFQEIAIVGVPLGGVSEEGKGGAWGGLAASIDYTSYGHFNGRDAAGATADGYHAEDVLASLGWGIELFPGISGGLTFRGGQATFANQSYNAFTADAGVLWKALPSLDLGAAYSNVNLGGKAGGNALASGWRLGAGWAATKHWLLAASGELQDKSVDRLQLGTEYRIGDVEKKANVLSLRAGYGLNFPDAQLTGLTGLTLGLGYTITRAIRVDYAMLPSGELGNSHRVSLTFMFGCPEKRRVEDAPKPAPAPVAKVAPAAAAAPIAAARPYEVPPVVVKTIELEDSHFDFDKATLRPQGMAALRENIQILKDNPQALVRVAGYTSMSGTPEYNQRLSEKRATAVRDFLVKEGRIAPNRITSIGYGETRPKSFESKPSNINSPAAKSNMRVLFEITVK